MNIAQAEVEDIFLMDAGKIGNALLAPLDRIREADPVYWSEKSQCWFITRHEDVMRGFSGELPLSTKRVEAFALSSIPAAERLKRIPSLCRYTAHLSVDLDPPAHTRIRKLLVKAFNRKVVEGVRPFVVDKVAGLMDDIVAARCKVEFVEDIARKLPASVILKLIGLPYSNLPHMKEWANGFIGAIAQGLPDPKFLDEGERVTVHMAGVVREEIARRRRDPGTGLLAELLKAHEDGDQLSEDELIATLILLIVAGHDTTSNTLTLIVLALAEHPELWDTMYRHPEKIPACGDELMRHVAMSFLQPRIVAEDFTWHGKQVKRGQLVMLVQGTGNRDPRSYPDPQNIDVNRSNEQVLTFGPGLHHCLGHLLAKMQVAEFLTALVTRFSGVEILDRQLDYMPQIVFRGLFSMNARFTPRKKPDL